MKKAQSAVEAAMIMSMMTLTLIVFLLFVAQRNVEAAEQRQRFLINDVAESIKTEINIAVRANEGYNRTFTLPATIDGMPYSVQFIETDPATNHTEMTVKSTNPNFPHENAMVFPKNIMGSICIGSNSITKGKDLIKISCNE